MAESATGRGLASCLILAAAVGGCGTRYVLDLTARPDGVKLIGLMDERGALVSSLGPIRTEGGRRVEGPRLDLEIRAGLRPVLVELDAAAFRHPRGDVDPRSVALVGIDALDGRNGSRLVDVIRLPGTTELLVPSEAGGFMALADSAWVSVAEGLRLRREVETEPCPPPVGLLRPFLGGAPLFRDLPGASTDGPVLRVLERAGELVALGGDGVVRLEGDRLPVFEPGPLPRPWLDRQELGSDRLVDLLPLGREEALLVGRHRVWGLRFGDDGFEVTETASVGPHRIWAAARFGAQGVALVDARGVAWLADSPTGPWRRIDHDRTDTTQRVAVAGRADGVVVRGVDDSIGVIAGAARLATVLEAPGRYARAASLLWRGETLWVGGEEGDLFRVGGGFTERFGDAHPPRLEACAPGLIDPDAPHVPEAITGMVSVGDFLLLALEDCAALLAHRVADGCQSLVLPGDKGAVLAAEDAGLRIYRVGARLFVASGDGRLLVAELLEE